MMVCLIMAAVEVGIRAVVRLRVGVGVESKLARPRIKAAAE
jgi:hypothetical protein